MDPPLCSSRACLRMAVITPSLRPVLEMLIGVHGFRCRAGVCKVASSVHPRWEVRTLYGTLVARSSTLTLQVTTMLVPSATPEVCHAGLGSLSFDAQFPLPFHPDSLSLSLLVNHPPPLSLSRSRSPLPLPPSLSPTPSCPRSVSLSPPSQTLKPSLGPPLLSLQVHRWQTLFGKGV